MAAKKKPYYPEQKRRYYQANKEKISEYGALKYKRNTEEMRLASRKYRVRSHYFPHLGIEEAWATYQQMMVDQNYLCAVCGKPESKIDPQLGTPCSLAIDHCHETGEVRALLCFRCNTNLGWFENMFDKFTSYLAKHRKNK